MDEYGGGALQEFGNSKNVSYSAFLNEFVLLRNSESIAYLFSLADWELESIRACRSDVVDWGCRRSSNLSLHCFGEFPVFPSRIS